MLIFDIETGPLPESMLLERWSYPGFEPLGEFDATAVKVGNLKDQAKIAEKIEAARAAHEAAKASAESDYLAARDASWNEFIGRAGLQAATGQVLAIGYHSAETNKTLVHGHEQTEAELLNGFWSQYARMRKAGRKLVGFNSNGFDVPFLLRRSWMLGVDVPPSVRNGRWLDQIFVDLREVWLCGQRWGDTESSLNHVAGCLGVGQKTDGVTGADFARLWAEDREKAIEYLTQDVQLTYQVAVRLGVV